MLRMEWRSRNRDLPYLFYFDTGPDEGITASLIFSIGDCGYAPHPVAKPTPSPTKYPTYKPYPTYYPTVYPTTYKPVPHPGCVDEVYTEYSCYGKGDNIVVYFYLCDPMHFDWAGIYDSSVDYLDEEALPWQFLCGDQECDYAVREGHLTFKDDTYGPWPLPTGTYKFHLIREGEVPYHSYTEVTFVVKESSMDCYNAPTPKPKPIQTPYPTKSPVDKPTPKPTVKPTFKPTPHPAPSKPHPSPFPTKDKQDCSSMVTTDMVCYDGMYDVVMVDFKNCDPGTKDWI